MGGRHGFPGFYRVFVSTAGLESFPLRPEKFSNDLLSVVVVYALFLAETLIGCDSDSESMSIKESLQCLLACPYIGT